ncbi:hypothetical protein EMCRGX_G001865 [Ephydatia muelleri]
MNLIPQSVKALASTHNVNNTRCFAPLMLHAVILHVGATLAMKINVSTIGASKPFGTLGISMPSVRNFLHGGLKFLPNLFYG